MSVSPHFVSGIVNKKPVHFRPSLAIIRSYMATLIHRSGSRQGRRSSLKKPTTRIGRKADNDILFEESVVSSYHAEIRAGRGSFAIIDLKSTNGTFVNGKRVTEIRLRDGDRIEIGEGGPALEFRLDEKIPERGPRIVPRSGPWEEMDPVELSHGTVSLGRNQDNDIVVGRTPGSVVSGHHAKIRIHDDSCEIEDLESVNGTFINGRRVRRASLHDGDRVELGEGGPLFEFRWGKEGGHEGRGKRRSEEKMLRKLERAARGGPAGDETRVMLDMVQKYHKRHIKPYVITSVIVAVVAAASLGASIWYFRRAERLHMMSSFYEARKLSVRLSSTSSASEEEKHSWREERRKLEEEYDKYLEKAGWYKDKTREQRAVLKMVRRLGETELDVPEGFYETVMDYIAGLKKTARLRNAMQRAKSRNLLPMIRSNLEQRDLPREFLFIAFQESGFDSRAIGPPTRIGVFAKGMWQLIPGTAKDQGLELGLEKDKPVFDPSDQRHDEIRSTQAAAGYLAWLYATKAQASGLLVIASYNYGSYRIIKKLDELENEPRVRNFWYFYRNQWLPKETREYVFTILAAALICEDPDLFGYSLGMPSPLQ